MIGIRTAGAAAIACIAIAACTTPPSRGAPAEAGAARPQAFPVRWAHGRALEGGEDWVDIEAVLDSPTRVPLGFKVAGRIATLRCEEGATVDPDSDEPIATIETADYEIAKRAAQATLARAAAAAARARGVGIPHARRELDRGRTVAEAGVIPERDLEGLETQLDDAEAQAREAAAAVAQARVLVEQADAALADTVLRAPFEGLVVKNMAAVGQLVGQGMPVCVVERSDVLNAIASVPGRLLPSVDRSREVVVTVHDAGEIETTGTITAFAWAGDVQTGTFPVKVAIDNPRRVFRSGMQATVRLPLRRGGAGPDETMYEIPLEALVTLDDITYAFAAADAQHASARRVRVDVRELGRDGMARVAASFPGPLLVVVEGQNALLDADVDLAAVEETVPP